MDNDIMDLLFLSFVALYLFEQFFCFTLTYQPFFLRVFHGWFITVLHRKLLLEERIEGDIGRKKKNFRFIKKYYGET